MFVIPKKIEGTEEDSILQIVDPDLKDFLPAEGREVTPSEYWTRRVRDGDVTERE